MTVKKVEDAIDDIKKDGGIVTKKKLIALTELSNSTFSKPHVVAVLKEKKVCQFKPKREKENENKEEQIIKELYKKIQKLENENRMLKSKLQDKEITVTNLNEKYGELDEKYMIILGKLHMVLKKIDTLGIDIGLDLDNL